LYLPGCRVTAESGAELSFRKREIPTFVPRQARRSTFERAMADIARRAKIFFHDASLDGVETWQSPTGKPR
jgi:hypothetical protein